MKKKLMVVTIVNPKNKKELIHNVRLVERFFGTTMIWLEDNTRIQLNPNRILTISLDQ